VKTVLVTCTGCQTTQSVIGTANRFVCKGCQTAWRFATCQGCGRTLQVEEQWSAWTCDGCGRDHKSASVPTVSTLVCFKCKASTEVVAGARTFRCAGCRRLYQRCVCGQYATVSGPARLWRCSKCKRMNPRAVATQTTQGAPSAAREFGALVGRLRSKKR
jgi:hypothetical protein